MKRLRATWKLVRFILSSPADLKTTLAIVFIVLVGFRPVGCSVHR
jgi:hypothetical protein